MCTYSLVLIPEDGMVSGKHLAVKDAIVGSRPCTCDRAADLDGLVQGDMALLEGVRVLAA